MKFDPKKLNALPVQLHGHRIGVINRLGGDRHLFAFEQDYIDDPERPTLSLSFKGQTGGLVTSTRPVSLQKEHKDLSGWYPRNHQSCAGHVRRRSD
ncbi:MAG TPA: HipA N-terminal domain-containing protein [Candidatus Limnocylindrales bacterium]|nr:HipA N-terminal domain-containing protein [Candidatus Limnocylindrales bacterium]